MLWNSPKTELERGSKNYGSKNAEIICVKDRNEPVETLPWQASPKAKTRLSLDVNVIPLHDGIYGFWRMVWLGTLLNCGNLNLSASFVKENEFL